MRFRLKAKVLTGRCDNKNLILDGQQRITSIVLAYLGLYPDIQTYKKAIEEFANDNGCGSFELRIKAINNGMLGDLQTKLLRFFLRITFQ